jgi:hypothetical protein
MRHQQQNPIPEHPGTPRVPSFAADDSFLTGTPSQGYWTDEHGNRSQTRGYRTADINAALQRAQSGQLDPAQTDAAAA